MGIPFDIIRNTLKEFKGAKRRLQLTGRFKDILVYDDYGHHPREISATLRALRQMFPTRKVVTVFQPHRYTRTAALYRDFADSLSFSDRVLLLPIYPADEEPLDGVFFAYCSNASRMVKKNGFFVDPVKLQLKFFKIL